MRSQTKITLFLFAFLAFAKADSAYAGFDMNAAFAGYLSNSPYSGQVNKVKELGGKYQSYMQNYKSYTKQYEDLAKKYKDMGSPKNMGASFMAEGQRLADGAIKNYKAAASFSGQMNNAISGLEKNLSMNFNASASMQQIAGAAKGLSSMNGQLSGISSQLNSLSSMAKGNIALSAQISGMQNYVAQMKGQISGLQGQMSGVVSNYTNGIMGGLKNQLSGFTGAFSNISGMMGSLTGSLSGMANGMVSGMTSQFTNMFSGLTGSINGLAGSFSGLTGQFSVGLAGFTGNMGGQLSASLGNMMKMPNGFGNFGQNGFQMPAMQQFNPMFDFMGMGGNYSGNNDEKVKEQFEGLFPDNNPDAYWTTESEGGNAIPTLDEAGGTYGKVPITIGGANSNAPYQMGFVPKDSANYVRKAVKQQDGAGSIDGKAVGYKITGNDGKSAPMQVGQHYNGSASLWKVYVNNWGKASGNSVLIKKVKSQNVPKDFGAQGFFYQEQKGIYDASGQERGVYSTKYKDDNDAIQQGACQMVAMKSGGAYNVTPGENGSYQTSGSMSVVPERIINTEHPYAPRNKSEWQQRTLISGGNTTQTCGQERLIGNKRAWEEDTGSVGGQGMNGGSFDYGNVNDSLSKSEKAAPMPGGGLKDNYEYYKLPLQKGGKILSTPKRVVKYDIIYDIIFDACVAVTYNPSECDKLAKRIGCRIAILPPEIPENYLKMSYNQQHYINPMPWIFSKAVTGDDFGYPDTTGSNVGAWAQGYLGLGTSWDQILPHDKFGYNMPPLINWPTGKPASLPIIQQTAPYNGKENQEGWAPADWEYWRTTITGVNSRFKPDESNPEEIGVQGFSCLHGGWNELVLYQANCNRYFGLNCICDYFKNFWRGSALGYAMARAGGYIAPMNEGKTETKDITLQKTQTSFSDYAYYNDQKKFKVNNDASDIKNWQRILNNKQGDQNFEPTPGKKMPSEPGGSKSNAENWPGKGKWLLYGLDNAEPGDIIIWDKTDAVAGGHKRPLHAAYVERVTKDKGNACVEISESNNGVTRDACENTENWGRVTQRTLCKNDDQSYTFNENGKKGLKDCANNQMSMCWEKQWTDWKVYKYKLDKDRVTDPKTGDTKNSGQCQQWEAEMEKAIEAERAEQTGGWEGSGDKKSANVKKVDQLFKKLKDYGCNPSSTKWNIKSRDMRAGGITEGQYTPTAPQEPVSAFDFVYNIRLNAKFKDLDIIPKPQVSVKLPQIDFNDKDKEEEGDKAPKCGDVAIEAAKTLKSSQITYKDDCAGNQAAPNKPSSSCAAKQYGRYGFIYAVYNNEKQSINVDGLWRTAPAHAAPSSQVLAFKNTYDNKLSEPNGCRLTNLGSCAKPGDIVLVQYGNGFNRLSPYNRFLLYAGNSSFYEVQESGATIKLGSLPVEYTNSSYEVQHLSCNN